METVALHNATLITGDGRSYNTDSSTTIGETSATGIDHMQLTVNPGASTTRILVFEVPAGAKPASVLGVKI